MIVIDASAMVMALLDSSIIGQRVRQRVVEEALYAPELLDLEVAAALLGQSRRGRLTAEQVDLAFHDFGALTIRRCSHVVLLGRVRELFDNVTPYDASYVALAELLEAPLVTADPQLSRSGRARCSVELFSSSRI